MKRFISCVSAIIIAGALFAGCGSKDDNGGKQGGSEVVSGNFGSGDASGEDMPYGATVTELRPESSDAKVMIGFDKRFFCDAEQGYGDVFVVSDFIAGMNRNDHELIKKCYYDGYLERALQETSLESVDDYIDSYVATLSDSLGEGFNIDYIDISDCCDASDSNAKAYFDATDDIIKEFAGADVIGKITSRKLIQIGGYSTYSLPTGVYQLTKHMNPIEMAIYCIDGTYYLF